MSVRMRLTRTKRRIRLIWHFFYPYTALNGLDKKLLPYLPSGVGYFIEAGANDGIRQSNTFYLEKKRSWTGLLIEPIPRLADQCKRRRKNSTVVQVALVPPERSGSVIKIIDLDLMTIVADQASGVINTMEHIHQAEVVQGITPSEISVPGFTLSEILDQQGNPEVTLLSLDVEGFEVDVLRGLNFSKNKPLLILVETRGLNEVKRVLGDHYELLASLSHHDFLFKRR